MTRTQARPRFAPVSSPMHRQVPVFGRERKRNKNLGYAPTRTIGFADGGCRGRSHPSRVGESGGQPQPIQFRCDHAGSRRFSTRTQPLWFGRTFAAALPSRYGGTAPSPVAPRHIEPQVQHGTERRARYLTRRRIALYFPPRDPGCIAQLVEQLTLNQRVQGSSPCAPTTAGMYITNSATLFVGGPEGLACRRSRRRGRAPRDAHRTNRAARLCRVELPFLKPQMGCSASRSMKSTRSR